MPSVFKGEAYYRGDFSPRLTDSEIRQLTYKLKGMSRKPFTLQELGFLYGSISDGYWYSVPVPLSTLRAMIDKLKQENVKTNYNIFGKQIMVKHRLFNDLAGVLGAGLNITPGSMKDSFVELQLGRRRFEAKVAAFTQNVLRQPKHRGVFVNSFNTGDINNPVLRDKLTEVAEGRKRGGKLADIMSFAEARDLITEVIRNSHSSRPNDTMLIQHFDEFSGKTQNYLISIEAIYYALKVEQPRLSTKGMGISFRLDKNAIEELIFSHILQNKDLLANQLLQSMPLESLIVDVGKIEKESELSGFRTRKEVNKSSVATTFRKI